MLSLFISACVCYSRSLKKNLSQSRFLEEDHCDADNGCFFAVSYILNVGATSFAQAPGAELDATDEKVADENFVQLTPPFSSMLIL